MANNTMIKTGYDTTKDVIINLLKGKELGSVKVLLEEMSEELHFDGIYFVTYQDFETLLIASKSIETIVFDMGQDINHDVIVTKIDDVIGYQLDLDTAQAQGSKQHLNLIKVLQTVFDVKLETNFPSTPFNIKVAGESMPAMLFSRKDLK